MKRLLGRVFGVLMLAQHTNAKGVHPVLETTHQFTCRILLTSQATTNQFANVAFGVLKSHVAVLYQSLPLCMLPSFTMSRANPSLHPPAQTTGFQPKAILHSIAQ
jgi:hypothetical protein